MIAYSPVGTSYENRILCPTDYLGVQGIFVDDLHWSDHIVINKKPYSNQWRV